MSKQASVIILAAGEGTRMKSAMPKVAHEVLGAPMVQHVVRAARESGCERVIVVTGHGADVVEALLTDSGVEFARQHEQLGTGHAVMCALEATGDLSGPVVILAGDVPLIRAETIARLVETQSASGVGCVMLSAHFSDPTGYGRVIRDDVGAVTGIIEHKDLPQHLLGVTEGNVGIYCFDGAALSAHLHRLEADNSQAEYYLTDLIGLFVSEGLGVEAVLTDDTDEAHGVNSRVQLAEVTRVMQRRINEAHMLSGVSMTDPGLVWIGPDVRIGSDVLIEPMTILMGATRIANSAHLGPCTRITDCEIGAGVRVDSSVLNGVRIDSGAYVGPFAHRDRAADAPG